MMENNPENVSAAFEILLEEIEAEIDFIDRLGAKAFEAREYDKVREALERVDALSAFRDKAAALRREWEAMDAAAEQTEDEETRQQRRNLGRLRRGLRTPEQAYYISILQAIEEAGGSAPMGAVLDRVGQLMAGVLKDVDHEPLASDPELPRWRNAAQWARHGMVREGLLKADSPRGIWEITDLGRERLRKHFGAQ